MNAASTASVLVGYIADILYVLILARIVVSWLNLSPWNPLVRWLRRIVDPILRPFRRILPAFGGIDFSPLLAILVIFFLARVIQGLIGLTQGGSFNVAASVISLISEVVLSIIILLAALVLVRLLLSLFNADPWHPLVHGIRSITNPLVAPFAMFFHRRRYRPGVDYPAIVALAVYVALYFVARFIFDQLLLHTASRF
ncbi:MAG TPA: YggT family protein [Candidatus Dormibacteraeota bacterium]|nr:YggT family protein [Candidatus Dormibacteraeota bacterium]